jgi:hypothetical protein
MLKALEDKSFFLHSDLDIRSIFLHTDEGLKGLFPDCLDLAERNVYSNFRLTEKSCRSIVRFCSYLMFVLGQPPFLTAMAGRLQAPACRRCYSLMMP